MSLKFSVSEDMGGYALHIDTPAINAEVGATENELRRLLIDIAGEIDISDTGPEGVGGDV